MRIIGGEWRSRRIVFADLPGLRPTQDRIRETLFNWLSNFIHGAVCLDLFAGSGALGFEALSRGAQHVCFVDTHARTLVSLRANTETLAIPASRWSIVRGHAPHRLPPLPQAPFDIVFLDPPFHQNLLPATIAWLQKSAVLKPEAWIYIEMEKNLTLNLPDTWEIHRHQATPQLIYQLVRVDSKIKVT